MQKMRTKGGGIEMCQKMNCPHGDRELCTCSPVKSKDMMELVLHVANNLTEPEWEL